MKTALKTLVVCGFLLAMLGGTPVPTSAQTVCQEAPFLAVVDSNGDGIATAGEILAIAPDNAELQAVVGQLQAQGYSGIQYTGCDGSTGGDGSGTGTGGTGDGSGTGTTGGEGTESGAEVGTTGNTGSTRGTGTDDTGEAGGETLIGPDGEPVVVLPSTGYGGPENTAQSKLAADLAVLGAMALLLGLWSRAWRRA